MSRARIMPPLVSILVPAFNAERWLAGTLRSALAQTWPRTELIVVDDGSRDRTLAVARQFERGSVKVVSQPNRGACAARNTALQLAQGDYVQWLDADDLLDPEKIRAQMRIAGAIGDPRVLLSCPFGTFFFRPERARFARTSLWRDLTPVEYFLARFRDNAYVQTGVWLVSRELTSAAGRWTEADSPDDDGEYFCRVAMKSRSLRFVEEARIYYRVGNTSGLSQRRSHRAQTALFASKVKCIRHLLSLEDSVRTREASVRLLQDWMPELYPDREDLVAEAQRLAASLGGSLQRPPLKWKYRPIEWVMGYRRAVQASRVLPILRSRTERKWDEVLYRLSGPAGPAQDVRTPCHAGNPEAQ